MFNEGVCIPQIAKHFNSSILAVMNNIEKCIHNGFLLKRNLKEEDQITDVEGYIAIEKVFEKLGTDFLKPVYDALDSRVSYDDLRKARIIYLLSKNCDCN